MFEKTRMIAEKSRKICLLVTTIVVASACSHMHKADPTDVPPAPLQVEEPSSVVPPTKQVSEPVTPAKKFLAHRHHKKTKKSGFIAKHKAIPTTKKQMPVAVGSVSNTLPPPPPPSFAPIQPPANIPDKPSTPVLIAGATSPTSWAPWITVFGVALLGLSAAAAFVVRRRSYR